jgi:hypothetical protein
MESKMQNELEQEEQALAAQLEDTFNDVEGETKAEKFSRIATARLRRTIKALEVLENCANTATYEYTQEQVDRIEQHLTEAVKDTVKAFRKTKKADDEMDFGL